MSRKAMEWLICFSVKNLMLGCLLFKKVKKKKKKKNPFPCQKLLERHHRILNKI